MATTDLYSQLMNPVTPEIMGLERQRQYARMLMQQSAQPQGQMVSGQFVAPSWAQQLNAALNPIVGAYLSKGADEEALKLAQKLRQQEVADIERFTNLQRGIPAVAEQYTEMAGPFGEGVGPNNTNIPMPVAYRPAQAAVEPNRMAALQFAAQSASPTLRQIGLKAMTEGPIKVGVEDTLIDPITMQPIFQGAPKVSQDIKDIARQAKLDIRNIDNWTDQDWQKIRNIEQQINESKRTVVNMPSEGERKAGFMANILDKNIAQMQAALGVDPTAVKPNVPASIVAAIAGENVLSRAITPAQRQIIEDSQLDVLDAALTLRTGAAYTREQLLGMRGTYFPRIGDSPETVKAKQNRLETLLSSAYIAAGRATPPRLSETPPPAPARPTAQQLNVPKIGGAKAPAGVDQAVWNAMTPQEKALWK